MVVMGAIGWWIGSIVDNKWETSPWGILVGIIAFVALSLFHILRVLRDLQDRLE
jgi:F0F1-type ATP synthase assembly protein I